MINSNDIILENLSATVTGRSENAANIKVQSLIAQINHSKRRDFAASCKQIRITNEMPEGARDCDRYAINIGNDLSFGMTDFCVKQLNNKLSKGFASYASELDTRGMNDLYLNNVNELLQNDERKNTVRVLQNGETYARAVVSDKYAPIDDVLVFGSAFNVLQHSLKQFKPLGGRRTDTRTYCKFVSREPVFSLEIGGKTRDFSAGFCISNSEVGLGHSKFEAFFTDSYCDNGIIFSKNVIAECKFKHIGSKISTEFGEILGDNINRIRNAEIAQFITQATELAVLNDPKMIDPIREAIEMSSQRKLLGEETESIKNVLKNVGIAKSDFDNVIKEIDPADDSQFGVQAAITQFAQKVDSYEKRIELEKRGGEVLQINARQWNALQAIV